MSLSSSSYCGTRSRVTSISNSPSSPSNELHHRSHSPQPHAAMNDSEASLKKAVYGDSLSAGTPAPATPAPKADPSPKLFGMPLKYVSLVTLAIQNAALAIMMHYSRVSMAPSKTYSAGSAVLLNELLKGSISLFIALLRTEPDTGRTRIATTSVPSAPKAEYTLLAKSKRVVAAASPPTLLRSANRLIGRFRKLGREVFSADCWKLSIPAILYVIQNNLQFVAASNLDVATFQVTYQMKILATAGFSVLMLRKKLSTMKWLSLLGLAIGVGVVQIQTGAAAHGGGSDSIVKHVMNPTKGFLAVSSACVTSGLAGVYFEMVLKGSQSDLWVRNVQLSLFSLLPALVPVFFSGSSTSASSGGWFWNLFENFGGWAWATVLMQVFGGLVTAVVIKYADNIMKGFATSLSIIISFLASVALFDFSLTVPFVVGSSIVLAATWFYNQPAPERPREVFHEKEGGDEGSGMRVSLSSLSLTGGGRRPSNIPGSPVDSSQPILGEMAPKKKSPLPTPGSIASAVKGFISRPSSPSNGPAGSQGGYFPVATGGVNGTPLNRTGSTASLHMSKPPSRNQPNIGLGMSGMSEGHRSSGSAGSDGPLRR